MINEKQVKKAEDLQKQINQDLASLTQAEDFKEYFKLQREIIRKYVNSWVYIERILELDPVQDYRLLLKSFKEKNDLGAKKSKIDKNKTDVIEKFNKEISEGLEKHDFQKTSEKLFYVLLGNVLEHIGRADIDMKKFDIEKDLYPNLQMPLGLTFFLFQNLIFGRIALTVNKLSKEYLQKYCALLLGLWRTVFELMRYEKQMEAIKKKQDKQVGDIKDIKAVGK
ncbi:MAG: hypothetical protein ABIF17_03305 [Patescibacteria group bacterium]